MQWYKLLTEKHVEQVHEESLLILEQIGIVFHYRPALEVLSGGGAKVDENTLALYVIKKVGLGGQFLDTEHTLRHFRSEFYQPGLSDRDNFENWKAKGSPQTMESANKMWKKILEEYEAPELPPDIDKDLQKFIKSI